MHVLHRSHLGNAIAVTVIAALLAIVLTLAIASRLSDQAPAPLAGAQPSKAHSAPSNSPFTRSPFSNFLAAPVEQPWTSLADLTAAD